MKKTIYKTSMDSHAIIWTILFFVILGVVFFTGIFTTNDSTDKNGLIIITLILSGIILFVLLTQIRHYEIRDDRFIIKRPLSSIVIPFSDIRQIEKGTKIGFEFKHTFKQLGNGGVFGYWGTFYSDLLQEFELYAKNRKNPIVLTVKKQGKIVVSPDDAGMFEELEKALKVN